MDARINPFAPGAGSMATHIAKEAAKLLA